MAGFQSVLFIISWGAITATGVQSVEVHTSSDDGAGDAYTAITGTKVSAADDDDNQLTYVEIHKPLEQYLKLIVNRATANSAVDGIIAIQYNATHKGTTHDSSTVTGGELHVSAAEGTA